MCQRSQNWATYEVDSECDHSRHARLKREGKEAWGNLWHLEVGCAEETGADLTERFQTPIPLDRGTQNASVTVSRYDQIRLLSLELACLPRSMSITCLVVVG